MPGSDAAQVPLDRADAELPHPEVAQAREDLLIEAIAVSLHRRGAQVLQCGEPGFGESVHSSVWGYVATDVDPRTVSKPEP